MRTYNAVMSLLAAACLAGVVGCKKAEVVAPVTEYNGIKIDWPKLDSEFANASPELQGNAQLAKRYIRYSLFPRAMIELDKLANTPGLNESQKKAVTDLMEQTKEALAKAPLAPGQ